MQARQASQRCHLPARGRSSLPVCSVKLPARAVVAHSVQTVATEVKAGPIQPCQVDYSKIDSQPLNQIIMGLFRRKMVAAIGDDTPAQG